MRLKKTKFTIILFLLVIFIQLFFIPNISQADKGINDMIKSGDEFISQGNVLIDKQKLNERQEFIYNSLLTVGIILTVLIGGFLGIKFMIASAEDKAEIKQMLIPYVIGCVVIYGAFGIWKIIIIILDQMT